MRKRGTSADAPRPDHGTVEITNLSFETPHVPVTAAANPLRGITADSAYIAAVLEQVEGPVVAVGRGVLKSARRAEL
jgi:hypothetical protein